MFLFIIAYHPQKIRVLLTDMGVLLEDPCLLNCSLPVPDVAGGGGTGTTAVPATTVSSLSFSRFSVVRKSLEDRLPSSTPWKINMKPENQPLEMENPIGNHHFEVPC